MTPLRAGVSSGPNEDGYPQSFYDGTTGVIDTVLYINLDNSGCTASNEMTIHEFGHALGLGDHFEGFGSAPVFWATLKTLYNNAPGTAKADVQVVQ